MRAQSSTTTVPGLNAPRTHTTRHRGERWLAPGGHRAVPRATAMMTTVLALICGAPLFGAPGASPDPGTSASAAPALAPVRSSSSAAATAATLHEIPPSVMAHVFLKAEDGSLNMLVRVPLESLRDVIWPLLNQEYLVISRSDSLIREAARLWIANYVSLYEEDRLLGAGQLVTARISLPDDRSFNEYRTALLNLGAPTVPDSVMLPWKQALIDVHFTYPIQSADSRFSVRPELAHLGVRTTTVLRFLPSGSGERVLQYTGNPGIVHLDPSWRQASFLFMKLGFLHILGGIDHLLFLLCLVIPFRRLKPLTVIVTSFTVAHSITLIASAMNLAPTALWFTPLIEVLIALSIVIMAFENIVGARLGRRWLIVFLFGLVHGFGFSFFLRESLQFAGSHLATSLFAFNVGVELGQLLAILVLLPILVLLFRYAVPERIGTIILSALVAHTAWHWTAERGGELAQYDFQWPVLDAAFLAGAMRWLMLLLILVGVIALLMGALKRFTKPGPDAAHEG